MVRYFETILSPKIKEDNSNDQGKEILERIEFWVSKIVFKDICIKENGLWVWGNATQHLKVHKMRQVNTFFRKLDTFKVKISPLGTNYSSISRSYQTKHPTLNDHFPSTGTIPFHSRLLPERWPVMYFFL